MRKITVYGSGCRTCASTKDLIRRTAEELGVDVDIEEVTDTAEIMSAGIMSTPGIALDGEIVHAGSQPTREMIAGWLGK